MAVELEELLVADAAAWRAWLADHHATVPGVWLALTRKGGTATALDYEAAVRQALCFGWIDGQMRRRDEQTSFLRFTPRRARSPWSTTNVARVAELDAAGLIEDAGRVAIEAAQADGRWERAYEGSAASVVPDDLAAAIAADPAAQAMFDVLTRTNRYALIHRVGEARRPETRARRIEQFVAMLARGETPYAQQARPPGWVERG